MMDHDISLHDTDNISCSGNLHLILQNGSQELLLYKPLGSLPDTISLILALNTFINTT